MYGAVWIPDWLLALTARYEDVDSQQPLVVTRQGRVICANYQARTQNILPGMLERRISREAGVIVVPEDRALSAQKFNDVMEIISSHVLHCAMLEPGLAVFIVPRTHTINQLAELFIGELALNLGLEAHIGCAPGVFAAVQAAYRDVYAENIADILDDLSIKSLLCSYFPSDKYQRLHEFIAVAELLGLKRISDIRNVDRRAFLTRFGKTAQEVFELITGADPFPQLYEGIKSEVVEGIYDEPVAHPDQLAFLVQSLAYELVDQLNRRHVLARELRVVIKLNTAEHRHRAWRMRGMDAKSISQRVRWQLSAWLREQDMNSEDHDDLDVGIVQLTLGAYDLCPFGVGQELLWGDDGTQYRDVHQAVERVRSLLGQTSVIQGAYLGGRYPRDAYANIQWGTDTKEPPQEHWESELPHPWPTLLLEKPEIIQCEDANGHECLVSSDGVLFCREHCENISSVVVRYRGEEHRIIKIAGPWIHSEGWWATEKNYHRAWMQCVGARGAFLIFREHEQWWIEGIYQ